MKKVEVNVDGRKLEIQRKIADVKGGRKGPLLIITSGMHGNEPMGVLAAHDFIRSIEDNAPALRGRIVAFAGNLEALRLNQRFVDIDLNRIWDDETLEAHEASERDDLWQHITSVTQQTDYTKLVHIDLHSTSSPTVPFLAMSKTEPNQRLSRKIPVPSIMELDKELKTPLLSKIASMGHASMAFEGGMIGSNLTYRNHLALLWVITSVLKMLPEDFVTEPRFQHNFLLRQSQYPEKAFKISYVHRISPEDEFLMQPGFKNFQPVKQGVQLATDSRGAVTSPSNGLLFMPLYQARGSEGFYLLSGPAN